MTSLASLRRLFFNNDDLSPYSENKGATQNSIKAYVDTAVSVLSGTLGTGSNQEVVYDAITIATYGEDYPLEQTTGNRMGARQGRHVWENFDTDYNHCKVRLYTGGDGPNMDSGNIYEGGPFTDIAALYSWANNLIPNNGSSIIGHTRIEVYDIVSDVPQIQKVYGYNNLYCACAGSGNSRTGNVKTASEGGSFLWDMFTALTTYFRDEEGLINNITTGATLQAENPLNRRVFWLPSNKKNIYALPITDNSSIKLSSSLPIPPRRWWNENSNTSRDQNNTTDVTGHTILSKCYITYYNASDTWILRNNYDFWLARDDNLGNSDSSTIVVYIVKNYNNANEFGFYIKPLGVDRIMFEWIDTNLYNIEALAMNSDRQPWLKRVVLANDIQPRDFFGDRTIARRDGILFNDSINSMRTAGSLKPRYYKFRLRRKSDNKVGPLTSASLVPVIRTRGARVKWIVK